MPEAPKWTDRGALLEALKTDPYALTYASKELQEDREMVLETLRQMNNAVLDPARVVEESKRDGVEASQSRAYPLHFSGKELQSDRAFMLEAMAINPNSWQHASEALWADKHFVLAAVQMAGEALRFASPALQDDREVVLAAVRQDAGAIHHAGRECLQDKGVILAAVSAEGQALRIASSALRADRDVVIAAVKEDGSALIYAAGACATDEDLLVLAARMRNRIDPQMLPLMGFDREAAAFLREDVKRAKESAIASEGEEAPILSARLSQHYPANGEGGQGALPDYRCEVSLMSGVNFAVNLPSCSRTDQWGTVRPHPIVNDLAKALVAELPQHLEVTSVERVFINFAINEDGDGVSMRAWDWDRPLSDFLPQTYAGHVPPSQSLPESST